MNQEIKDQFINVVRHLKKLSMNFPSNMDLSMTELLALKRIEQVGQHAKAQEKGCRTIEKIHENLHISRAALSQTLNALEKKAYIERHADPKDRRKIQLALTEQGKKILDDSCRQMNDRMDRIIEKVGEKKIQKLIPLFEALIEATADVQKEELAQNTH